MPLDNRRKISTMQRNKDLYIAKDGLMPSFGLQGGIASLTDMN
jgi:hypothetical protein